jgi:glycosyltransferase involved in cell wall biosynthesis
LKKVLFLINTLGGGGAEKVLVNLVNNLNMNKYDITVKTLFDIGVNRQFLNSGIKYEFVFKKVFRGNSQILKLFPAKILYSFMIKEEFDIVIAYMHGVPTRIVSGCRNLKTKLIAWLHTDIRNSSLQTCFWNDKELVRSMSRFNRIVGVSKTVIQSFSEVTGIQDNLLVRYNTIDVNKIITDSEEPVKEKVFNGNRLKLCSVGRLVHVKGYDRLIRVHKRLIENGYEHDLLIFGDGEEKVFLDRYIKENNLKDTVHLMGFHNNPYKYIKKCDLFVCSSRAEGLSTAVSEAIILGLPVITTMCSGMTEILGEKNEYGLIVDNNEESLYQGLLRILNDRSLLNFYRERAKERKTFFSIEETVKEIENLLDGV